MEQRTFKFGTTQPVELTMVSSSHHIELNPSDAGIRDREVVQEVIKEIAQSAPVIATAADATAGFKIVVLNEVERLSKLSHARIAITSTCAEGALHPHA